MEETYNFPTSKQNTNVKTMASPSNSVDQFATLNNTVEINKGPIKNEAQNSSKTIE